MDALAGGAARDLAARLRLRQPIRDLFLAVWEVEPDRVRSRLPEGFEPVTAGARAVVAVACFRNGPGRLGPLPVPPYAEIDLRTFVADRDGSPAVFVFDFFVPVVGFAAAPFGVPVKVERIRVSRGRVSAPKIGVAAEYVPGEAAELGEVAAALSTQPAAYWIKSGRLRRMAGGYHGIAWRRAELGTAAQFGPATRIGLDPGRPDHALYAERAELRARLPAGRA